MKLHTHKTSIEVDDTELPITVTWTYYPGSRGHHDKYGAPEEPDEPPSIELVEVKDDRGGDVELTPEQEKRIENELWDCIAKAQSGLPNYD